jgi:hypothetical protein
VGRISKKIQGTKWMQISALSLLAIIVLCFSSISFRIITIDELPINLLGAIMGAAVSAVLMVILLSGQSAAEEVKERNVKVFEKKSELFEGFIHKVWAVYNDQRLSSTEYKEIASDFYRNIMIYLDPEKVKSISDCLSAMGKCLDKDDYASYLLLRQNMVIIINLLSEELGLGGKIDDAKIEELDANMFPALFRSTVLDAMNAYLVKENEDILEAGRYEVMPADFGSRSHEEMIYTAVDENYEKSYPREYLIFPFKKHPGFALYIGSLGTEGPDYVCTPHEWRALMRLKTGFGGTRTAEKDFLAMLEESEKSQNKNNSYFTMIRYGPDNSDMEDHDLFAAMPPGIDDPYGSAVFTNKNIVPIDFFNVRNLTDYRTKWDYREAALVLARRAAFYFSKLSIDNLSLREYLDVHFFVLPKEGQTPDMCMKAVTLNGLQLQNVREDACTPEQYREICLAAVKQNGKALAYAKDKTPGLCMAAIENNAEALEFVPEELKTEALCLTAVRKDGSLLEFVPEELRSPELLAAVEQSAQ